MIKMVQEYKYIPMAIYIQDNISMEKNMEKVNSTGSI